MTVNQGKHMNPSILNRFAVPIWNVAVKAEVGDGRRACAVVLGSVNTTHGLNSVTDNDNNT